jgi:hypothetical protein
MSGGDTAEPDEVQVLSPSPGQDTVSAVGRLVGGLAAGAVSGLAMYLVMAAAAVTQGRSALYPAYAVQAMLSGRRVLPDHPVTSLYGRHAADAIVGPVAFLLPALAVAVAVVWWLGRRRARTAGDGDPAPGTMVVLLPTALVTAVLFLVLVVILGFHESDRAVQRFSSGFGVRQLGMGAWLVAHVVYATVFTIVLGPTTGLLNRLRRSRRPLEELRGERSPLH